MMIVRCLTSKRKSWHDQRKCFKTIEIFARNIFFSFYSNSHENQQERIKKKSTPSRFLNMYIFSTTMDNNLLLKYCKSWKITQYYASIQVKLWPPPKPQNLLPKKFLLVPALLSLRFNPFKCQILNAPSIKLKTSFVSLYFLVTKKRAEINVLLIFHIT